MQGGSKLGRQEVVAHQSTHISSPPVAAKLSCLITIMTIIHSSKAAADAVCCWAVACHHRLPVLHVTPGTCTTSHACCMCVTTALIVKAAVHLARFLQATACPPQQTPQHWPVLSDHVTSTAACASSKSCTEGSVFHIGTMRHAALQSCQAAHLLSWQHQSTCAPKTWCEQSLAGGCYRASHP